MQILHGEAPADLILSELKNKIKNLNKKPCFAIIQVGNNSVSNIYISKKIIISKEIGINHVYYKYDENVSFDSLKNEIIKLNNDKNINGIIVQLPIPKELQEITNIIDSNKDIDGLSFVQKSNLYSNIDGLYPCTAIGVIYLLKYYNITIESKKVAIIGRSNLVGKPLAMLFLKENAMISIFHSKLDKNILREELNRCDIICSAVGAPSLIESSFIKNGAILIDIGCQKIEKVIYGDIDPSCYEKSSAYTPMPGGIGPMTIAFLMHNIYTAYCLQNNL